MRRSASKLRWRRPRSWLKSHPRPWNRRLLEAGSVALVSLAAALWAFDAYFRPGLTKQLSSGQIVLVEDLLISLCLLPVLVANVASLRWLSGRRWVALAAIAIGPQAVATVLFTKAIGYS